jgi:hypothetical protein
MKLFNGLNVKGVDGRGRLLGRLAFEQFRKVAGRSGEIAVGDL